MGDNVFSLGTKKQKKTNQKQTLADVGRLLFVLFTLIKQRQHHKKDVFRLPDPRCYNIIRHGPITASGASASREITSGGGGEKKIFNNGEWAAKSQKPATSGYSGSTSKVMCASRK